MSSDPAETAAAAAAAAEPEPTTNAETETETDPADAEAEAALLAEAAAAEAEAEAAAAADAGTKDKGKKKNGSGEEEIGMTGPAPKTFNKWGKAGNLTEKEKAALEKFMAKVTKEALASRKHPHDSVEQFALRWLRARDFKVSDSVTMFENHLKWVKESDFYGLQFSPLSEIVGTDQVDKNFVIKHYPCGIKGYDRHGRPLYIKLYGRMQPKKIAEHVDAKHAAMWESVIGCLRLPYVLGEASKRSGNHVEEMVAIIDCKGFKLKTFNKYVREVLKQAAAITDPNYPEALGLCVVINAPWFVKTIWAIARGFLAKRTRKKFRILGKKFHSVLHGIVDPSNLPKEYGGTGEHGFKTIEELLEYDKAFAVFNSPEYHAAVKADPRNAAYLEKAEAQAVEAAAIRAASGGGTPSS